MTSSDDVPAAERYESAVEWEDPRGLRRVLAGGRAALAALVDSAPAGYAPAAVVVRRRHGARAELMRISSDAQGVGALEQRIERDLRRFTEKEFLREWGDAHPRSPH